MNAYREIELCMILERLAGLLIEVFLVIEVLGRMKLDMLGRISRSLLN